MDEDDGTETSRFFMQRMRGCVQFFNLYRRFRIRFPKKGSLAWVIKKAHQIQEYNFEVVIKDHMSSVKPPPGVYTEAIQLYKWVTIQGKEAQ